MGSAAARLSSAYDVFKHASHSEFLAAACVGERVLRASSDVLLINNSSSSQFQDTTGYICRERFAVLACRRTFYNVERERQWQTGHNL